MTRAEIASMIESVGLPYAYDHFDADTEPPFICFLYPSRDDFIADDASYLRISALVIELYTDNVDFALEGAVESALTAAGLPFTQGKEYIDSERMYQTVYNTEVILTDETTDSNGGTNNHE